MNPPTAGDLQRVADIVDLLRLRGSRSDAYDRPASAVALPAGLDERIGDAVEVELESVTMYATGVRSSPAGVTKMQANEMPRLTSSPGHSVPLRATLARGARWLV
jgi:hypothetical protein